MIISSLLSLYIASIINPDFEAVPAYTNSGFASVLNIDLGNILSEKSVPVKKAAYISPIISPKSAIAVDNDTGAILFEKNADEKRPIASITKLMTILIILDENELSDTVTVSSNAASSGGSTMFLHTGEKIAVENLIYGALIGSSNDAAIALAEHNAGSTTEFIKKMNKKAKDLKLTNTHFSTSSGLGDTDNYSSARDLSKLARQVYKNKFIQHAAELKEIEVLSNDGSVTHKIKTTNELLGGYLNVKGLKTGTTDAAGQCLVTIAENEGGHEITTVLLHSPDRFTEAKILIDWVFRAFNW
ncbi:D-alanyl-D-alanine carboxypeptidase [Candidatus Gracilibacteria bacterium]|jgi:D-alanyl-D-alanine carboxypeptidase|nr:D-alanyl-D-alanine carboxypeptidase [Candidatus Gracilibacteria bacterium]